MCLCAKHLLNGLLFSVSHNLLLSTFHVFFRRPHVVFGLSAATFQRFFTSFERRKGNERFHSRLFSNGSAGADSMIVTLLLA